jgi:hypothetical protein
MKLNDKDELLVTGIVADPPRNLNLPFGMLVSYDFYKRNNPYYAATGRAATRVRRSWCCRKATARTFLKSNWLHSKPSTCPPRTTRG